MKKYLILFLLVSIVFSMTSCGGSGAGSSSSPPGGDPNVAFYVKLRPSQIIAQTNTFIYFHARVINREGNPIPNIPVYFTNISPIGTFDVNPPVVNTDQYGYATVKLLSTTEGFATVQAEVNTGSGQVRDRKTVFFSVSMNLTPFMFLDVDGNNNGIYNEPSDFILFENSTDNEVLIRATVFNRFGQRASGSVVTFGADFPYKIGSSTTCSDKSSACEVTFPNGNTATTNSSGEAFVLVRVDPLTIRNITTILNITASADNGAFNMVTLELLPVTISTVTVSAAPTVVVPGGTSTITAAVTLNTGNPAFDGTVVSFTTTCGSVTPFAQTTDGAAAATFTAPSTEDTCTITATAGGVSASVNVTVTSALTVQPTSQTISGVTGGDATYTIFGGLAPYTVSSTDPTLLPVLTDNTFTVTVPANTPAKAVTYTVRDSAGATVNATLTITAPTTALSITPTTFDIDSTIAGSVDIQYFVSGGSAPYTVYFTLPMFVDPASPTQDGDTVGTAGTNNTVFTVRYTWTAGVKAKFQMIVVDSFGSSVKSDINITSSGGATTLTVTPPSASVSCTAGGTITFFVTGGVAPYTATSTDANVTTNPVPPATFTGSFTATLAVASCGSFPAASTPVSIVVQDSASSITAATLTVTNP